MSEQHSERNIWLEALLPDVYCNRINSKSSEPIDHLLLQDECCFCSEKINGFKISSRIDLASRTDNRNFCTKCLLLLEENYKQLMNETENQNYYNEMVSSEYIITFVFPKPLSVADVFFGNKWETKPELKEHLLEEDEGAANEPLTTTFPFNSVEIVSENGDTTEIERQREPDIVDINEHVKSRTLQIEIRKRAPAHPKKRERTQTSVRNHVINRNKDKQFDFREHLFEKANEASITTLSFNSEEAHTTEPLLENTENMDIERDEKPDIVNTNNQDNSQTLQLEIRKPKLDRSKKSLRPRTRNKEEKCDLRQHLIEDANETSITTLSIKSEEIHITESPLENDDNMNTECGQEPNIADINDQDNSQTIQFEIRKPAPVRSKKSKRTPNVESDVVNRNRDKCDSNQHLLEDANEAPLTTFKSEEIHITENEENMDIEWQREPDIVDVHQNISETIQFKIRKPAPARSKEKSKNKNEGFVCRICATFFSDRGERGTHERNRHRSRTTRLYQCTNCDFSRKHVRNMEFHCRKSKCTKKKLKQQQTICGLCKLPFDANEQRSQKKFAAHVNKTKNLCNDCNYSHKNVQNVEQHAYRSHKNAAKTKCRICNEEGFATQPLRNIHEMEAHMDRTTSTYLCSQCNTKFSDKNEFIYHLRVHNGEKLFVCNICGKGFGFSCYLDQHMIVHKETKEFECDICGKNFSTKIRIKAHLDTHSENKQYKCDQCDKSYRGRTDLRRHKYTHEGIQPRFTCNICEKKFFEPSFLKVHMKVHT